MDRIECFLYGMDGYASETESELHKKSSDLYSISEASKFFFSTYFSL